MNIAPSKATKRQIKKALNDEKFQDFARYKRTFRRINNDCLTGELVIGRYNMYDAKKDNKYLEYRLIENANDRNYRIWKKVKRIYENDKQAIFLTMTFNDLAMNSLNEETRRRYIKQFLRKNCSDYLANIDFGEDNHREHYHAIVTPKENRINLEDYRTLFFGSNINAKLVRKTSTDYKKAGRYINKLTNHSLKDNGFYQRLIFSRKHI